MTAGTMTSWTLLALLAVPQDTAFADFRARVDAYATVRASVQRELGLHQAPSESAADLGQGAHRLAEGIRKARRGAKRGDLFTPATEAAFRKVLRPLVEGPDGAALLKTIGDDMPPAFTLAVNAEYPKGHALTSVPIDVLQALPSLPSDIEYRFVPRHLILFDSRANVVLDYVQIR
jgi:hypothetical protein